jgi:N-acetylmuramoyl-L-alanine amidase
VFDAVTEAAVVRFQQARGLRATGTCDDATWHALVEAGWKLGDRMLRLTSPNMRGDDVSALQAELGHLGFDPGRVDGILGPRTAGAVLEFQRSCGLPADGVCGPESLRYLLRLGRQSGTGPGVSALRDAERLRDLPRIVDCRVVVGQFGGLSALTRAVARSIRSLGADVVLVDEPDVVAQAEAANRFHAHAYLGFEASFTPESAFFFYRVPAFESAAGRALAEHLGSACGPHLATPAVVDGIRIPVLRETRMPAVFMRLGAVRHVVDRAQDLADAMAGALRAWVEALGEPSSHT